VLESLRAGRSARRVYLAAGLAGSGIVAEIRKRAEQAGVPVSVVPRTQIDKLSQGGNHQGVLAHTTRYRYAPLEDLLRGEPAALLFLDGVTDPHNTGALIRSAEGAGFAGVVLPARRSSGVTGVVRRVSAGATETMPVARVANLARALEEAKSAGLWIVGLAEAADDDLWSSALADPPVGLVVGAEGSGISRNVAAHCDGLVRIPMGGHLHSLNASVAGGIAMFEIARRRGAHSGNLSAARSSTGPQDREERGNRA
jgi:23S rRNA (guanosine2251-2'-O)-methyltransferase